MFWSKPKVNAHDKAVLDLKMQRDKIKQYQKRIAGVVKREHELAKECLQKGNKQKALILLRQKKYQEQLLIKTDQQLETLEELVSSIEFSQIQNDVVFGLEQGSKVLKELNKQISIDRVDKIMDDTQEGISYQKQVSEMLADKITMDEEAEIEDELEALERAAGVKKENPKSQNALPKVPTTAPLPDAPSEAPEEEEEEGELLAA